MCVLYVCYLCLVYVRSTSPAFLTIITMKLEHLINNEMWNFSVLVATPSCEEGAIRLRNGSQVSVLAGRIEICINNQWSAICNDGWSNFDAAVACRQLGQSTITPRGIRQAADLFGQGDAPVLISNVACQGHENAVIDCPKNFVHDCLITDVAGVQCIS